MTFYTVGSGAATTAILPSGDTTGVTDTAAINAAINAAFGSTGALAGAEVKLGPGVFWVNGVLMKSRVRLVGSGFGTRLKATASSTAHVVGSAQVAGNSMQGVEIADMVIDGNRQNGATGRGISYEPFDQTENIAYGLHDPVPRIHDVQVLYTADYGIYIGQQPTGAPNTAGVASSLALLDHCFVYGTAKSGYCIAGHDCVLTGCQSGATKEHGFLINATDTLLRGCKAWYAGLDRTSGEGLGDVATTGLSSFDGFHVSDNITVTSFVGCQGQDNGRHDLYIGSGADGTMAGGMVFGGSHQSCVYIDGASDCAIDGHLQTADRFNPVALVTFNGTAAIRNRVSMTYDPDALGSTVFFALTGSATMQSNTLRGMQGEGAIQTPAYAASFTPNLTLGDTIDVGALTGNITIGAALAGYHRPGARLCLILTQDGTGSRTVTWHSSYTARATPAAINSAANARTVYEFKNVSLTATPNWQVV